MHSFYDYIVFVDESGDHSLESIDPSYPIFVLAFCLYSKEAYASEAAPAVLRFKFKHFGHDQTILHEREIRKAEPPFAFLTEAARRGPFYDDLNELIRVAPFTLVSSAIRKHEYRSRYASAGNPYHIAVGFGLERIYQHLKGLGCRGGITHMIFERRGRKEDTEVELEFRRVCDGHNHLAERMPFEIVMSSKQCNSAGLQVADLVARPIGRHILAPEQPNRAFDIIEPKFRRSPQGRVYGWGLKVFP